MCFNLTKWCFIKVKDITAIYYGPTICINITSEAVPIPTLKNNSGGEGGKVSFKRNNDSMASIILKRGFPALIGIIGKAKDILRYCPSRLVFYCF